MLAEKILTWLSKTGFPLEMEAASAFRAAGFDVRQSAVLPDTQSEKGREIDVLATDPDLIGIIKISFVVECKSSQNPWIVFASEDALANYNQLSAFGVLSTEARNVLSKKLFNSNSESKKLWSEYLNKPPNGGYGFRQAFGKESDPAYSAAIGTLKACHGLTKDKNYSIPYLAFSFPVIVIDSPLFECYRKENGDLELTEVSHSEFLFSAHIPENVGCCVKIIRKEYLSEFAVWAKKLSDTVRKNLEREESEILKRHLK